MLAVALKLPAIGIGSRQQKFESRQEVTTVLTYRSERPSALAVACAPVSGHAIAAHPQTVGIRVVQEGVQTALVHAGSGQVQRTQALRSWRLADQGLNGFAAMATGIGTKPIAKGVRASGVPPRGRPV